MRRLVTDAIIFNGVRVPLRLLKHDGITHVVAKVSVGSGWSRVDNLTVTACRGQSDVPWSMTSRFRPSKIDCMSCLVALARI